jgi:hypothetical protein
MPKVILPRTPGPENVRRSPLAELKITPSVYRSILLEQVFQIGKRLGGGSIRVGLAAGNTCLTRSSIVEFARMLVVVAVETEQLPVAAVSGVVVVIVVTMVNGQLLQILARKLAGATTTYPRVDFQRLLPIPQFASLSVANGLGNHAVSVRTLRIINSHSILLE